MVHFQLGTKAISHFLEARKAASRWHWLMVMVVVFSLGTESDPAACSCEIDILHRFEIHYAEDYNWMSFSPQSRISLTCLNRKCRVARGEREPPVTLTLYVADVAPWWNDRQKNRVICRTLQVGPRFSKRGVRCDEWGVTWTILENKRQHN